MNRWKFLSDLMLPRSVDISLKDDMTVRDGPYGDNEVI